MALSDITNFIQLTPDVGTAGQPTREQFGDKLTDRQGTARRPAGRLGPDDERTVW